MTTNFIHTLEAINLFLVFVMLFQVRKYYKLFSNLKLKAKHKQKTAMTSAAIRPATLDANNQNRPTSKYYFHNRPELEASISSDHDMASFTKAPLMNKPKQVPRPTHKAILNNYIDDFFCDPLPTEVSENNHFAGLDFQINAPINDEFIT